MLTHFWRQSPPPLGHIQGCSNAKAHSAGNEGFGGKAGNARRLVLRRFDGREIVAAALADCRRKAGDGRSDLRFRRPRLPRLPSASRCRQPRLRLAPSVAEGTLDMPRLSAPMRAITCIRSIVRPVVEPVAELSGNPPSDHSDGTTSILCNDHVATASREAAYPPPLLGNSLHRRLASGLKRTRCHHAGRCGEIPS